MSGEKISMRWGAVQAVAGAVVLICALPNGVSAQRGRAEIAERHRHRYELNNDYRDRLSEAGMVFSGTSPDGRLVEIVELPDHPFFVASQFHPEFQSQPFKPHPLFEAFIRAAAAHRAESE